MLASGIYMRFSLIFDVHSKQRGFAVCIPVNEKGVTNWQLQLSGREKNKYMGKIQARPWGMHFNTLQHAST